MPFHPKRRASTSHPLVQEVQARQGYLDAELGQAAAPSEAKSLETTIQLFMDSKRGEHLAENTLYMLYEHTLTLNRLRDFSTFRSMAIYCRPSMLTEADFELLMGDSATTAKLA